MIKIQMKGPFNLICASKYYLGIKICLLKDKHTKIKNARTGERRGGERSGSNWGEGSDSKYISDSHRF